MKSDPLITCRRKPAHLDILRLEKFARALRDRVAKGREFHCLITGDAELRKLNREFLGKDYATDVLSFPGFQPLQDEPGGTGFEPVQIKPGGTGFQPVQIKQRRAKRNLANSGRLADVYLGDIAISLARARAQAREQGHELETEVRILMLHGVLHLLGMDHEADSGEMARAEKKWRRAFGLPSGLIERAA